MGVYFTNTGYEIRASFLIITTLGPPRGPKREAHLPGPVLELSNLVREPRMATTGSGALRGPIMAQLRAK